MLTESDIEQCIEQLKQGTEVQLEEALIAYLEKDTLPLLSKSEIQLFDFILSVLHGTIHDHYKNSSFSIDDFIAAEEANWAQRDKNKKLSDSIDSFFDSYHEEDLLAFVEDMLADDEDAEITETGREIIFITCKSFIDSMTKSA